MNNWVRMPCLLIFSKLKWSNKNIRIGYLKLNRLHCDIYAFLKLFYLFIYFACQSVCVILNKVL